MDRDRTEPAGFDSPSSYKATSDREQPMNCNVCNTKIRRHQTAIVQLEHVERLGRVKIRVLKATVKSARHQECAPVDLPRAA